MRISADGKLVGIGRSRHSQSRHHLLHLFRADVGVNLGGGDTLVAEQGLDVHQLGSGVKQIGGVSMAQLVPGNLLVNTRFLEHPAQVGPRRLRGHRLLTHRPGEHKRPTRLVFDPEAEGFGQRHQPLLVALANHPHRLGGSVHLSHVGSLQVRGLDYRYAGS